MNIVKNKKKKIESNQNENQVKNIYDNHKCLCNFMHCENNCQQLDSSENDYCQEKKD